MLARLDTNLNHPDIPRIAVRLSLLPPFLSRSLSLSLSLSGCVCGRGSRFARQVVRGLFAELHAHLGYKDSRDVYIDERPLSGSNEGALAQMYCIGKWYSSYLSLSLSLCVCVSPFNSPVAGSSKQRERCQQRIARMPWRLCTLRASSI